jgi:serine/threonine protein kinase
MPLAPGSRLGPYDIVAPLGAGGMGEVYRARDARLKRDVAIKVLLEAVSRDPDRLARLQREAEALAAPNHPNVAQIYGLEDGPSGGAAFAAPHALALVMELVEGPTLADRLADGSGPGRGLPVDDVIGIGRQIAEAVEAGHEKASSIAI